QPNNVVVAECGTYMADEMPERCVDLVVTSPPYDNLRNYDGYSFDAESVGRGIMRVLKDGGVAVWVVGDRINGGRSLTSFEHALMFRDLGFRVHDVMIYQKKNTPFMRSNAYTNAYELMLVLSKGAPSTFNPLTCPTVRNGKETAVYNKGPDGDNSKRRTVTLRKEKTRINIWKYAVGLGGTTRDRYAFEHKAMFPEQLAADHILSWSKPGEIVLDPMCGAGTTLKMAALCRRQWFGIDISKGYVELSRRRISETIREQKLA
ncbi:MAG: site-specific DNA-methyltransferase, partial [Acidimicrobiaceae bacterium]|nr:site-specific DNA-methyltransferase [Acidimicrobiaceae bacterium]